MIYFDLFESSRITKGALKSCIFDLERNTYCSIPNELFEILEKRYLKKSEALYYQEYLNFLVKEGFIFYTNNKVKEKSINRGKYYSPFKYDDIIIDISNLKDFYNVMERINADNVETIQLRFFRTMKINDLINVLDSLSERGFVSVEILFNHYDDNKKQEYNDIYDSYRIISKMIVMNYCLKEDHNDRNIFFSSMKLESELQCGVINEGLFNVNLREFIISKEHNSCLYKKISIDKDGNIKNCPSMSISYGNIRDVSLSDVINNKRFQEYWGIKKDKIKVCKDCEFRYVCSDCRAYTERNNIEKSGLDISKPLKCGYDPYMGVWSKWSTNPLKSETIKFYHLEKYI
ncbi:grasp-with-spasm system SPASM domain peptide maturase [Elizabethkingia meningoseptica]|uniref:grasp-with-spasm system SPASM domain peptide maturase n=1 Tax=Elizabethkingia meningoseptica TaxID=238 RepID=UPI0022F14FB1|nr:grasp-with-spasm system SPASM domain peptide maturase [Elizabethkingia meningoseptica]EJK5329197.1 grasp-with-spasm system SPASM domain peptide maturase [Elizabethkingia meningoseptica]MDE5468915.1 grasp-with-spasm system SPASM domain peptide maturase [Elizabethkingia meningoseptica]MDE5476228.1 grasp-with-spasm system SPASM domain peptide maturase [Elizabethkingia meningoseptica]MDE5479163.1 grasp-with-spasm system SPASM domain peptide maturase [Elizabethkingia meningoseptica]MDE5485111.1 